MTRWETGRAPRALAVLVFMIAAAGPAAADDPWVVYPGGDGPGKGKHVVLVSGSQEYGSEDTVAQLGKILATHHGFKCTVLFPINPQDGTIDPGNRRNIPGLEALKAADLMIIFTRFLQLPDEQMRYIHDYLEAGKPVLGMRTSVIAFTLESGAKYSKYGDFGQKVLGQRWVSHHSRNGAETTRGVIAPGAEGHPIVRGCEDIWGPTGVYTVKLPLPGDCMPLVLGQVLAGPKPTDKPMAGAKNDPMMPVAWTKTYQGAEGRSGRVFTTTMGSATSLRSEGLRRLLANAVYWCVGLEDKIPPRADVALVGPYDPDRPIFRRGVKPADVK